jgi:Rrf2 family protein
MKTSCPEVRARYALHGLVLIARQGRRMPAHEIAMSGKLPRSFLKQTFGRLVAAGSLESLPGQQGGFRLTREPSRICLREIIEAIDGPVGLEPVLAVEGWRKREMQILDRQLDEVRNELRRHLQRVSLAELTFGVNEENVA